MQREDGSTFFAEVTLSPLVGDDGAVVGLHRGRARRDPADRGGSATRRGLRAIVDAANEAILGVDTDGTVLFFSPSAERLFGWSAGEIIGRSGDELVVPRYRIGPPRLFAELAQHGSFRRPTVALRRDGTHVEVELSAAEIIGKHGSVIGAALTVTDVSERKRTRRLLDRDHRARAERDRGQGSRRPLPHVQLAVRGWRTARASSASRTPICCRRTWPSAAGNRIRR